VVLCLKSRNAWPVCVIKLLAVYAREYVCMIKYVEFVTQKNAFVLSFNDFSL
jgi:hypothetical protein